MALFDGEHDTSVYSFSPSNMGVHEDSLLSSYRDVTTQHFRGVTSFRSYCLQRQRNFVGGSVIDNQYTLFTGVSPEDMLLIESAREVRGSMPKMCCLYDAREEVLIVKIMVGFVHESASRSFAASFWDRLKTLDLRSDIKWMGSTRVENAWRSKEADESFKPATRTAVDDWPSIAIEVGFSESLSQLQLDAHFWLTQSNMRTKIVIIIHIDSVRRSIRLERWEVTNPRRAHRPNVTYSPTTGCVQVIVFDEGVPYNGPQLELPVGNIYDTVPPNVAAGAFDMTPLELQSWNDEYWESVP